MQSIIVDENFVAAYFGGKRDKNYAKTIDIKNHMEFHFEGYFRKTDAMGNVQNINERLNPYFKRLVDSRRPGESVPIMDYRRTNYLPITKIPCHKISNSLKKIIKSQDWEIDYTHSDFPAALPNKETLQYYCEEDYPFFDSIENWASSYGLNQLYKDPNAIIVIIPMNLDKDVGDFYRPYSYVISSRKVYDYSQNEFVVYEEKEDEMIDEIRLLKIITTDAIYEAFRGKQKDEYIINLICKHDLGYLPAFILGGIPLKISNKKPLYESFLSPILPELDAVAGESSDLTAEVVQHIYSTMWYFAGQECNTCHGTGLVVKAGKETACDQCDGVGRLQKSPYKDLMLTPGAFDQNQTPVPPMGYVTKPTDIVQLQDKRIVQHIYNALSAINMEFLVNIPLNQSGKAKEVDRDELNNFVYTIAYHLVENILNPIYFFINEWRFKDFSATSNPETREKMLPNINIPERYDLLTENIIADQYAQAITNKFSDEVIENLEMEYVSKRFNNHPEILERVKVKKELDPFVGYNNEQKQTLLLTDGALKKDVIKSIYINYFITQAIIDNKDFLKMEHNQQEKIIEKYVDDKMKEMLPSEKVKTNIDKLNSKKDNI